MKQTVNLTSTNPTVVAVLNNDTSKAVSLRGAFLLGKNISSGEQRSVQFKYFGYSSFFALGQCSNAQIGLNPGDISYEPQFGKSVVIDALGLDLGESIYIEIDYELLDI